MKVLLVTSGVLPNYFEEFLVHFRHDIGTCDHLLLSRTMKHTNQTILDSQREIQLYDRSLFFYQDSSVLAEELKYFKHFDELTLMSLQYEDEHHRHVLQRFFKTHPWVRWFGQDYAAFDVYRSWGVDAYVLPKVVVKKFIARMDSHLNQKLDVYVLGAMPQFPDEWKGMVSLHDVAQIRNIPLFLQDNLKYGDVLLLSGEQFVHEHLVDIAMSQGGIVLMLKQGLRHHPLLQRSCVFLDNLDGVCAALRAVLPAERRRFFAERSFADVQQFSPERLAEEVARLIAFEGRDKREYAPLAWLRTLFG